MKKTPIIGKSAIVAFLTAFLILGYCPPVDPLDHNVLLPHDYCCNQFYSCSNGVPILMCCPDGLWFNAETDMCDWPQNVACRSLRIPVTGSCECGNNGGGGGDDDDDIIPGDPTVIKEWYNNVYVWMDPRSRTTIPNLFAPTSDNDPTLVGECRLHYKKHERQQTHSCYVTRSPI